jgi:hypothetical protein
MLVVEEDLVMEVEELVAAVLLQVDLEPQILVEVEVLQKYLMQVPVVPVSSSSLILHKTLTCLV